MAITFVGSSEQGVINGGNATLNFSPVSVGDYVLLAVTLGTSRTTGMAVTSSSGAAIYTTVVSTVTSSFARFAMFRNIVTSTGETTVSVTGTGGTSDALAAVVMVFSGVDPTTPEDVTATSTTGSGTTPDSPSITVASCGCAIISAFGAQVSDTAVTAPSSFLNQTNVNANDTIDATTGQAWLTFNSTSPVNPTSWSNLTSATWISATVALRPFIPPFTWLTMAPWAEPDLQRTDILGY